VYRPLHTDPVTIGFQAGGQAYSEMIFLKDNAALANT
jgi:hypothetical protein